MSMKRILVTLEVEVDPDEFDKVRPTVIGADYDRVEHVRAAVVVAARSLVTGSESGIHAIRRVS